MRYGEAVRVHNDPALLSLKILVTDPLHRLSHYPNLRKRENVAIFQP